MDGVKDKADEEALHWLIALEEAEDDADMLARFRAWLSASTDNLRAWDEARHVWNLVGEAKAVPADDVIALAAGERIASRHVPGRRRAWMTARRSLLAGAGLMAICLAVVVQPTIDIWLSADYSTGIAQSLEVRLDDGSTVHLGADSAIQVRFEPSVRRVTLLSGEAFFEVAADAERPFRVDAGEVETTVLGTAFNVALSADAVSVAVDHGRVGVAATHQDAALSAPLGAGDWVRVAHGGAVERGMDAGELAGGWRSGMLVVRDRPVGDVVDEIRRHYRGRIVLAAADFADLRVTGVYDLNDPVEALRAVAEAHGARLWQVSPWLTVVSRF